MRDRVHLSVLTLALLSFVFVGSEVMAAAAPGSETSPRRTSLREGNSPVLVSSSTGVRFKTGAAVDTFFLYGGPGSLEGKFQSAPGAPDRQGWLGVDLTDQPALWQLSTFCADNLNSHGAGNVAYWAGRTAEQEPGWAAAPGYGNNWDARLIWRATMVDPSVAQTVGLSFVFNHDTEPSWDFFNVEYDSAGAIQGLYLTDGSNMPFAAPGVRYPDDVVAKPIEYGAGGYGGSEGEEIVLRLRVTSDGAWSDEDGLFPTTCGAAIVDDVVVTWTDGVAPHVSTSDFDTSSDWVVDQPLYAGDFSKVFILASDPDVCVSNPTPAIGFVDDGTPPRNPRNQPPLQDPPLSTGGSLSPTWSYGVPGGWVVNYTGGLSGGEVPLANEVWSPEIEWDLPGAADDDPDIAGAMLRYSVWSHFDIINGMYRVWHVRTYKDGDWSNWGDYSFVEGVGTARYQNLEFNVTRLIETDPEKIQIALGVLDLAELFGFPGNDATPAPAYDNVALSKFRIFGPVSVTRDIHLFMDSFPQSGNADFTTLAGRQDSACRLDIKDVNSGSVNVPGDSMLVDVQTRIAGTSVVDVELEWVLDLNPHFDDVRVMPAGVTVVSGGAANGWDQWMGETPGEPATTSGGTIVEGVYFFDPPDDGFMYPGDVFRHYMQASDNEGRITTLPRDIGGFETGWKPNGAQYDPRFTVRALPSFVDDGQGEFTQPRVLFVNDNGREGAEDEYFQMFAQNGMRRGIEYDSYTVRGATSGVSNGIGSSLAHGATAGQLANYEVIVYVAGAHSALLLSDGTNAGNNDKGDDVGVLTSWFAQDDDRFIVHFADDMVSALLQDSPAAGGAYVGDVMGVSLVDSSVRDDIGGQTAPVVNPDPGATWLAEEYAVVDGCPWFREFDNIEPLPGASTSHVFLDPVGAPYGPPGRSASVTFDRLDGSSNRKVSVTFPYDPVVIWDRIQPSPAPWSSRSALLNEVLEFFGPLYIGPGPTDVAPSARPGFHAVEVGPNPFNPSTKISFNLEVASHVVARIYDLRGAEIAVLHEGPLDPGSQSLVWRGRDARGAVVASGTYFLQMQTGSEIVTRKLTLLK